VYQAYPFGLLTFQRPGRHTIAVSLVSGPADKASLSAIRLTKAE
jgi:hypothetical protein